LVAGHHFARDVPHMFPGTGELASQELRLDAHGLLKVRRMDQLPRMLEGRLHVLFSERQGLFRDFRSPPGTDPMDLLAASKNILNAFSGLFDGFFG